MSIQIEDIDQMDIPQEPPTSDYLAEAKPLTGAEHAAELQRQREQREVDAKAVQGSIAAAHGSEQSPDQVENVNVTDADGGESNPGDGEVDQATA